MKTVVIGSKKLTIEDVVAIAKKQVAVELDSSIEFQKRLIRVLNSWMKHLLNTAAFMA